MSENPTFQIPKDVIEPIVRAHIQTAVITALGDQDRIVRAAVNAVLNMKVDSSGKKGSGYSSDRPWFEWLMEDCLKTATREALLEEIPKHKEALKQAIADQLGMNKRLKPIAKAFLEGFVGKITEESMRYRITVELKEPRS